ncbi:MAG: sigma-70 family RNA polymerase sigma factor, partial [Elusimicrobiaceae bacterium]|nr:sigma-70 family RNA polymerase sigma factor [Elusimicrobiaceae bacterium]
MDKSIDSVNEYFKEIGTLVKQIDREKEAVLWKKYKKGDLSARDELFKLHVRLVIPTARRFLRPGCELMDLVEEGNLGLLQAIEKFDYKLGYRFSTYAIHWIEQFIRRSVEEQATNIKIPQHAWENLRTWSKALEKLKSKLNREPTLNEIAHELDIKAKQVVSILNTLNAAYGIDSLSTLVQSDED